MKSGFKSIIQYTVSIAIAIALLWYIFSIVDFRSMVSELSNVNYFWILASVFISLVSHVARALRWNLLLEPLGQKAKISNAIKSVLIGYLANYAVPRLGEVARCSVLKKTDDVPVNISLGTVITERVIDVAAMLIILGLSFLLEFKRLKEFLTTLFTEKLQNADTLLQKSYLFLAGGFIISVAAGYLFYRNREKIMKVGLIAKIVAFIKGLLQGLMSITRLKEKWLFLFYTFTIWFGYFLMTYVIFFAMHDTAGLPLVAGLVTLALGSLGMTAPVQGGIGAYHIMVATALLIYGVPNEKGLILATILHTSQFAAVVLFGGISLLAVAIANGREKTEQTIPV